MSSRCLRALVLLAVVVLALQSRPALAASSSRGGLTRGASSTYPAAAAYPVIPAAPGALAHPAARSKLASRRSPKKTRKLHGDPARATLAYQAMQRTFYIAGSGLYRGQPYSFLWPFSQALAATVSLAEIPGQSRKYVHELHVRLFGLNRYWDVPVPPTAGEPPVAGESPATTPPSYNGNVVPPAGSSYYDDNEWVGIELVRMYKLNHEAVLLERAEQIMAFVMAGWQAGTEQACPGGVPFSDTPENTDRNTVTDAPAAELGVQLYRVTSNSAYLRFAEMAYEWVRNCLLKPGGLYADHVGPRGVIDPTVWSYNQGTMIGAGTLLYKATGNGGYLYQARQTAKAALAYFTSTRLLSEIPFFPSVYFRNLLYLDSVTRDPPGPKLAQAYVDYAWQRLRLSNDLFVSGSPPSSQLLVQAAIVQIYALLSQPASSYF